jgi:fatty-acyl-CoA synthase
LVVSTPTNKEATMLHGDILGERARLTPERTALVYVPTKERLSYWELDRRATVCARVWREVLGLQPQDRCAILADNRPEVVEAFFAAGKADVVLVPLNTRLTAEELAGILADSGARALLYGDKTEAVVAQLAQKVSLEHWVALDRPARPDHGTAAELAGQLATVAAPLPPPDPEHIHCLLYTSGTTGRPKGVMHSHRMVAWNGYNTAVCWQLGAGDVSPVFTPLYHAGGLGAFLVPLVTVGGTVVLHRGFDVDEVLGAIAAERCTVVLGVPTIFRMLLDHPGLPRADLSSIRWLISGGAPLPAGLVEAFRELGVVLRQGYGLTEVGVNCFAMTDEEAWRKRGSIGRPLMFTRARLVDAAGSDVPPDAVGELVLRGPHLSSGYWHSPDVTAEAYDADGWFHTGDLARVDEDGFYTIVGRSKDMFISGGVNVYPAEVESALHQHPGVQDAAVVGVDHHLWGEVGVAFVVPAPGASPEATELVQFLTPRLARYKIPRDFVLLEELPRTAYGKVVKGELRARYLGGG